MKTVLLPNGYEISADLVLIGAGSDIDCSLASKAGLKIDENNGGVHTDPFLRTSNDNIFCAGDIASYPSAGAWSNGNNIRTEHWVVAQDMGSFAAFNMLGKLTPYGNTPFFFTTHYGKIIQYCGATPAGWDDIHIDGSTFENKFIAYYLKQNRVIAACS